MRNNRLSSKTLIIALTGLRVTESPIMGRKVPMGKIRSLGDRFVSDDDDGHCFESELRCLAEELVGKGGDSELSKNVDENV